MTVTLTRPTPESVAALPEVLELFEDPDGEWRVDYEELDAYLIKELCWQANDQSLFGSRDVVFWQTADSDGICDGGLVTIDLDRHGIRSPRLCSLHQDFRDLVDDRNSTGRQLAAEVLRNLKRIADELLANLGEWSRGSE